MLNIEPCIIQRIYSFVKQHHTTVKRLTNGSACSRPQAIVLQRCIMIFTPLSDWGAFLSLKWR